MHLSTTSLSAVPMGDHGETAQWKKVHLSLPPLPVELGHHLQLCSWPAHPGHVPAASPPLRFPHLPPAYLSPWSNHRVGITLTQSYHFAYVTKPNRPSWKGWGASWRTYRVLQPAAQRLSLLSESVQHPISGSPLLQLNGNESFWRPNEKEKSMGTEKSHLSKGKPVTSFWTTPIDSLD